MMDSRNILISSYFLYSWYFFQDSFVKKRRISFSDWAVSTEVTDLNISWNFMSRDGIRKLTRHIKDPLFGDEDSGKNMKKYCTGLLKVYCCQGPTILNTSVHGFVCLKTLLWSHKQRCQTNLVCGCGYTIDGINIHTHTYDSDTRVSFLPQDFCRKRSPTMLNHPLGYEANI